MDNTLLDAYPTTLGLAMSRKLLSMQRFSPIILKEKEVHDAVYIEVLQKNHLISILRQQNE